jgi:hypothetical protein
VSVPRESLPAQSVARVAGWVNAPVWAGGHSGATIAVLAVQYMWVLRRPWGLTAFPGLSLALAARPQWPPLDWTNSTSFVDSARPASRIRLTLERQAHWQWHGLSLLGLGASTMVPRFAPGPPLCRS